MNGIIYFDRYAKVKGTHEIHQWNVKTGQEKVVQLGRSPSFTRDGRMVYSKDVGRNGYCDQLMMGKKRIPIRVDQTVVGRRMGKVSVSPDGKLFAVEEDGVGVSFWRYIVIYDIKGKQIAEIEGFDNPVWHPNSKSLLITWPFFPAEKSDLFYWDMNTEPKPLGLSSGYAISSAFHVKDNTIMLAYEEKERLEIFLCQFPQGNKRKKTEVLPMALSIKERHSLRRLCFSPKGDYLATWIADETNHMLTKYTLAIIEIATRRRVSIAKPPRYSDSRNAWGTELSWR
jgi:WD40 repeat protein